MSGDMIKLIGTITGTVVACITIYEAGKYTVLKKFFKKNGNNGNGAVPQAECQRRFENGEAHFNKLDSRTKSTNREIKYTKVLLLEIVSPEQQKEAERKYKALIAEEGDE